MLGATGSIGRQGLAVADHLGMEVAGLAAGRPTAALLAAATARPRARVAVAAASPAQQRRLREALGRRVAFGGEAVAELAARPRSIVLNGIVGAAGLAPSLAALEAGNRLALANKESLVAGGPLVTRALRRGGGELIPVDSEHSAIWQCLVGEDPAAVRRLVLSASGGPFRGRRATDLRSVTPAEALAHPTWRMGRRVTIDSATLMNKAFEVIEAHHLFGLSYDRIEVVVHPQSIVHSLVEYVDGSLKAQMGVPDMRLPIQYALSFPSRWPSLARPLPLAGLNLAFEKPDRRAFPCLPLGYRAGQAGGTAPAILNAADEVAVAAFLAGAIRFGDIPRVVAAALRAVPWRPLSKESDVLTADAQARAAARAVAGIAE